MSDGLVVPPPPPPPPPPSVSTLVVCRSTPKPPNEDVHDAVEWCRDFPELRLALLRRSDVCCDGQPPSHWRYTSYDSLLQDGPTCGLVALSMLLHQRISVAELLEHARHTTLTNNGEMFSAKGMRELCSYAVGLLAENITIELCTGALADIKYVRELLNGCALLVPYDSDRNHSPCMKNGEKAHWALVTGVIVSRGSVEDCCPPLNNFDDVYVTAKHGKSLHLAVWRLKDLSDSNGNLNVVSEERLRRDERSYVVPVGGLNGDDGLNSQFVLVKYT